MTETTYGSRYTETKDLDIAQVAKLVRADIKAAKADGTLGDLPDGLKFSVRIDRYSLGQSLDIIVKDAPAEWTEADRRAQSLACQAMGDALRAILGQYNYDRSDSQSDYFDRRFYGHVRLSTGRTI